MDSFSLDFIQYWTAFQIQAAGGNPYDSAQMLAAQQEIRPGMSQPIMMWVPPWVLILMAPLLVLPFEIASVVWALCNVFLVFGAVFVSSRLLSQKVPLALASFAPFVFMPVWQCFTFGQISLLLLAGALALVYAALHKSSVALWAGIFIATLKPHLFFILGLVIVTRLLREGRHLMILAFVAAPVSLVLLSELIFPGLVPLWIEAVRNPGPEAVPPPSFHVTTLVGAVRNLFKDEFGMIPVWPMAALPLAVGISLIGWQVRSKTLVNLAEYWPGVLAVSYLFSPYGWTFDAVLLLPAFLDALARLGSYRARGMDLLVAALLIGSQIVAITLIWVPGLSLHQGSFWWLPTLTMVGWLYANVSVRFWPHLRLLLR